MTSQALNSTFASGWTSLWHWNSIVVVFGGIGGYVSHTQQVDIVNDTFTAAITVLVFLIPAAAVTGEFLTRQLMEGASIIAKAKPDSRRSIQPRVIAIVRTILDAAAPLRRGFAYCTIAVVLASLGIAIPRSTAFSSWVAAFMSAFALSQLVASALNAFPMAWRRLEFEPVAEACDVLDGTLEVRQKQADVTGQPTSQPNP